MVNDLLWLIARTNIALAVCVLIVLAVRSPTRRLFGARIAYALWLLPPLAAAACFMPGRVEVVTLPATLQLDLGPATAAPVVHQVTLDPRLMLALWVGGVAVSLIVLILRQTRFARALGRLSRRDDLGEHVLAAESTEHGPAVLGVLRPVIVTPADFDARFSDEERRIVIAHERAHMAQGDPLINAIAAALQCVNWFNPLVHIGVRALRVDQELACDAAVLATSARRSYAQAILKTQIAATAPPLGCAWPSPSLASLKERIAMLKHNLPTRTQRILGVSAVGLASFAACAVAWAAQPARVVVAPQTTAAPAATPTPLPASVFTIGDPDPRAVTVQASLTTAERARIRAAIADANLTPAQRARIEGALAGVANTDSEDADRAEQRADELAGADASDEADTENDPDIAGLADLSDLANLENLDLDGADGVVVDHNGHVTSTRQLTPEERARVRAAVQLAMAQSRTAMAHARVAMRDSERQVARAHIATRIEQSPQMQAEVAAIQADAERMAQAARMSAGERQAMQADMRARSDHIRAMARQMANEARAAALAGSDDHDSDDNN